MARKTDPRDDPNSVGSILMTYGLTPSQLSRAVSYRKDHCDILLGEACVRLNFITRETLETAVKKQEAVRGNGAHAIIELAAERTRKMSRSVSALAAVSLQLAEKIK